MVHVTDRSSCRFDGIGLWTSVCAGSIPEELGGLYEVEDLRLGDNKLTGEGRIANVLELECAPGVDMTAWLPKPTLATCAFQRLPTAGWSSFGSFGVM